MSKTLYVYLKGGRGDAHVTDLWDGAVPSEEGTYTNSDGTLSAEGREVGEPYRDIHNYSTAVRPLLTVDSDGKTVNLAAGDVVLSGTAMTAAGATPALGSGLVADSFGLPVGGISTGISMGVGLVATVGTGTVALTGVSPQVSDEVAHAKPRLFTKVCTWLIFQEVGGTATYKFRKAEVIGWGANPRSE